MARILTPSYTDDASHVQAIVLAKVKVKDDKGRDVETDATPGATLKAEDRVACTMTQGDKVYSLDTSQSNALAAFFRSNGTQSSKRGPKGSDAETPAVEQAPTS